MRIAALFFALLGVALAQTASLDFLNHNRPILDAHNCYPYQGRWADRIDRALKSGFPISIEPSWRKRYWTMIAPGGR